MSKSKAPPLALTLVTLLLPLAAQSALDPRIQRPEDEEPEPFQVFVRMKDQVFPTTAAYLDFCRKNRRARRAALRAQLLADLRRRSDASFAQITPLLRKLGADLPGDSEVTPDADTTLEELERYFLVNGFACRANFAACTKLAAHPTVAAVVLNPAPTTIPPAHDESHLVAGRRFGRLYGALRNRRDELVEQFTALWEGGRAAEAAPFDPAGVEVDWNLRQLGVDQVWRQEKTTGAGAVVAVMDTGCLPAPALVHALWRNGKEAYDGEDTDGNGSTDDIFGYDFFFKNGVSIGELLPEVARGSHMVGIVAGRPQKVAEARTVATGVAPRAQVMMLRATGHLGAFEYALQNGADVVQMGFGFPKVEAGSWRGIYRLAFEHLTAAGVVVVGPAGDSGPEARRTRLPNSGPAAPGAQITMPNDAPSVITVGGLDRDKKVSGASSRGPVSWQGVLGTDDGDGSAPHLLKPDVCAWSGGFPCWMFVVSGLDKRPGYEIVHHLDDAVGLVRGPSSTALAAAHVAGIAALMLSANPELPAWRVKDLLIATAEDLGEKGWDRDTGHGLVRALPAVRAAKELRPAK